MKKLLLTLLVVWICLWATESFAYGIDPYTVLMLHNDGTYGSTDFVDSSFYNHDVSSIGTVYIDTDNEKFGTASARVIGQSSITVEDSDDWDFGREDFTIDFWVKFGHDLGVAAEDNQDLIGKRDGPPGGPDRWLINYSANRLGFWWFSGGTIQLESFSEWNVDAETWYHIAIVRNDTHLYKFVNGTLAPAFEGSILDIGNTTLGNVQGFLHIGEMEGWAFLNEDVWFDEVRISTGIARWTSDFTPPTEPYSAPVPEPTTLSLLGLGLLGLVFKKITA